jgi:hypothetical protein
MTATVLKFQDRLVRHRGEMVHLTDMWRAAGADDSKRPTDWLALSSAREFIDHIATVLNAEISGIVIAERGGRDPATWAHWQIGFAYAKYLSPEIHAWMNNVVRAVMDGRVLDGETSLVVSVPAAPPLLELIELTKATQRSVLETNEIAREHLEFSQRTHDTVVAIRHDVSNIAIQRYKFPDEIQAAWLCVAVETFDGRCPCCDDVVIVDDGKWNEFYEPDHWFARNKTKIKDGWPTCIECNRRLATDTAFKDSKVAAFKEFHSARDRYEKKQVRLKAELARVQEEKMDKTRCNERVMTTTEAKAFNQPSAQGKLL